MTSGGGDENWDGNTMVMVMGKCHSLQNAEGGVAVGTTKHKQTRVADTKPCPSCSFLLNLLLASLKSKWDVELPRACSPLIWWESSKAFCFRKQTILINSEPHSCMICVFHFILQLLISQWAHSFALSIITFSLILTHTRTRRYHWQSTAPNN